MGNVKKKDSADKQDSLKEGLANYFKGVKSEWGKITWPERRQVMVESFIVLGVVFFFTVLVYTMDIIFKGLLSLIPNR